jgi:lipoprotein-anchoring transpeptidase ErfK/SrfK
MQLKTILSAVAIVAAAVSGGAGQAAAESRTGSVYNNVKYNFGSNTWKMDSKFLPAEVSYNTSEKPGTVIISTRKKYLYVVQEGGKAKRFGIGVGRRGFRWSGEEKVSRKAEWPAWHPPKEMIEREKKKYGRTLPARMEGGPNNPLGARALYLYKGGRDTLYRIHGTNAPASIGTAQSSGCIRMLNEEVIDLHKRVRIGAKVIVS